jgi:hypothetical protein
MISEPTLLAVVFAERITTIRNYSTFSKVLVFLVILIVIFIRMMNGVFYRYGISDYHELRSELLPKTPALQVFPEDISSSAINVRFYNNIGSGDGRLLFSIGYCLPAEKFKLRLNILEGSYPEASKLDPARSVLFRKFPNEKKGTHQDLPADIRIFLAYDIEQEPKGDSYYGQKCVIAISEESNCILYYLASW